MGTKYNDILKEELWELYETMFVIIVGLSIVALIFILNSK